MAKKVVMGSGRISFHIKIMIYCIQKLLITSAWKTDIITEMPNFYQISRKELIVLNPWFSGRGLFPGLMESTTSKPAAFAAVAS